MLLKFSLVIFDDCLAYELTSLNLAFIDDNFMMLSKLNFVVFDCLVKCFVSVVSFLDIMDDLEQIDWNRKYLATSLQHFLVFFDLLSILSLQLNLILALPRWASQYLVEFGIRLFGEFGWVLNDMSCTLVLRVY